MRLTKKRKQFLLEGLGRTFAFQAIWDIDNVNEAEFKKENGMSIKDGQEALKALVESLRNTNR